MHTDGVGRFRISEPEREAAMAALGRAFAEGRLEVEEYDRRVQAVIAAVYDDEVQALFVDLPTGNFLVQRPTMEPVFSAGEVAENYRSGRNMRLGLVSIATTGAVAAAITGVTFAPVLFVVAVTLAIALYVMKIGPQSWYAPSVKQIQRQRRQELRAATKLRDAELRARERERLSQLRLERKVRTSEITNKALGYVNDSMRGRK